MSPSSAPLGPKKEDGQDIETPSSPAANAFHTMVDLALAMTPEERRKRLGLDKKRRRVA